MGKYKTAAKIIKPIILIPSLLIVPLVYRNLRDINRTMLGR